MIRNILTAAALLLTGTLCNWRTDAVQRPKEESKVSLEVLPRTSRRITALRTQIQSEKCKETPCSCKTMVHRSSQRVQSTEQKTDTKSTTEERKTSTKGPSAISTQLKMMSKEERKKVTKNLKNSWNEF